jgi:hypothetical protein
LVFREINFHARVDVSVVGAIFFHFVSDKFEGLTHAVLYHFLFGLFAFLKLFEQNGNNLREIELILEIFEDLFLDLILVFVQVQNEELNEFSE